MSDHDYKNPLDSGYSAEHRSGKQCVERGCNKPAGTLWGPLWCPEHDRQRLTRIGSFFESARIPALRQPEEA